MADVQQGRQYDVAADGRFVINTGLNSDMGVPITLIGRPRSFRRHLSPKRDIRAYDPDVRLRRPDVRIAPR